MAFPGNGIPYVVVTSPDPERLILRLSALAPGHVSRAQSKNADLHTLHASLEIAEGDGPHIG